MFPPVPAPFAGSVPPALLEDRRLARLLDRCFAAVAVFTGACAGIEAGVLEGAPWPASLGAGCLAMLPPIVLGFWAVGRAGAVSGLAVARLYDRVAQHIHAPGGRQAVSAGAESPVDSFAGLVSGTVRRLRGSLAAHARTRDSATAASAALQSGRAQAGQLAVHLRGDGAAMASAASGLMAASARLAGDALQTADGAAASEQAVARLADQTVGIAGSVRHVSTQITRMGAIATRAAGVAKSAQARLAGLDTSARGLSATAGQVGRALQMAGACGRQAGAQMASGHAVSADLAENLAEMARCADTALDAMLATVTGLQAETAAANRRLAELSSLIESQHELGDAMGQAVEQQGAHVAHVLGLIEEAHTGLAAVRAGMDTIRGCQNTQLADAEALRSSIDRLPAHADTIAAILRAIPDFMPTALEEDV